MSDSTPKSKLKVRVPVKASVWYTASAVITKGVSMLSTPIFTRLLTESEYSSFPLYLTWLGLIGAVGGIDTSCGTLLSGMQQFHGRKESFEKAANGYNLANLIVVCTLYFAFYRFLGMFSPLTLTLSLMMFIQLFIDNVTGIRVARYRYEYRFKPVFFLNVFSAVSGALIALCIVRLTAYDAIARQIGLLIATGGVAAFILVSVARNAGRIGDGAMWKFLAKASLPLIPQQLASAVLVSADRLMITGFYGREALAKYSVAHSLGASVFFVTTGLSLALKPWIVRRMAKGDEQRVVEVVDLCTPLLSVAALLLIAISPEALSFLAPAEYRDSIFTVVPTALSVIPSFLLSVVTLCMVYNGKSFRTVIPTVICALLNVCLNALLMRYFPYTVAAISAFISGALSLVLNILSYKKACGGRLFSPFKNLSLILVAGLIGLFLYAIRSYLYLRAVIGLLIFTLAIPQLIKATRLVREQE